MLLARVPVVLHSDFYATAALLGAAVLPGCRRSGLPMRWAELAGGAACFAARLVGALNHWSLPVLP